MFCLISTLNVASVNPTVANGCGAKGYDVNDMNMTCPTKTGLVVGTKCYNDNDCSKKCKKNVVANTCL